MNKDELKEKLRIISGESTDENVISAVDEVMSAFDGMGDNSGEIERLNNELEAERERFRSRFWGGAEKKEEGSRTDTTGGRDYGSDDIINNFFEGV